jgi:hypothetical protein
VLKPVLRLDHHSVTDRVTLDGHLDAAASRCPLASISIADSRLLLGSSGVRAVPERRMRLHGIIPVVLGL